MMRRVYWLAAIMSQRRKPAHQRVICGGVTGLHRWLDSLIHNKMKALAPPSLQRLECAGRHSLARRLIATSSEEQRMRTFIATCCLRLGGQHFGHLQGGNNHFAGRFAAAEATEWYFLRFRQYDAAWAQVAWDRTLTFFARHLWR